MLGMDIQWTMACMEVKVHWVSENKCHVKHCNHNWTEVSPNSTLSDKIGGVCILTLFNQGIKGIVYPQIKFLS